LLELVPPKDAQFNLNVFVELLMGFPFKLSNTYFAISLLSNSMNPYPVDLLLIETLAYEGILIPNNFYSLYNSF